MSEQLCWPSGPKAGLDGIWAPFWYADVHNTTCFSSKSNLENNKIISNGLTQHQVDHHLRKVLIKDIIFNTHFYIYFIYTTKYKKA